MLSHGANDFNMGLTSAAIVGHESIVRLMLELGATNYNHAMIIATFYSHESVRLLLDHGASDYNIALRRAALKRSPKHSRTNSRENESSLKSLKII